jgi:ketosteroid isomerase-like protein
MNSSALTISGLREAVESCNAASLKSFYAPDAVVTIIDSDNPPSNPRTIRGSEEINAYIDDVCNRDMTHNLEMGIMRDGSLAFVQGCKYSDGSRVIASNTAEVGPLGITKQTIVQAWDS